MGYGRFMSFPQPTAGKSAKIYSFGLFQVILNPAVLNCLEA